jgi:type I restriction enzyme S subunit
MKISKKNWEATTFGEAAIQQKADIDRNSNLVDRYIAGEHMNSEDLHIRQWGVFNGQYLGPAFRRKFEKGDILYGSRRTYLKKVAVAEFAGITANTTFVIKANKDKIWPELLPFLMLSDSFTEHSIKHSKGSVNPYINWKDIANFEFKLPSSCDDQKHIADLLWSVDKAIEQNLILLGTVEIVKRACENKYFNKSKRTTANLEGVIKQFISGGTPSTKNSKYWADGDVPWITTRKMEDFVVSDGERYITNLAIQETNTNIVTKGNLLFGTRVGVGKCSKASVDLAINQDITGLVVDQNKIDPEYLFYQLISRYVQSQIMCFARGTTVKGITKKDLKTIKIVLDEDGQKEIGEQFKTMWQVESKVNASINSLRSIYKGIINQIFG